MSELASQREFVYGERDFLRVARMIHLRAGIALSDSKQDMVYSRLAKRLRATGMGNFADYLDRLESDPQAPEWEAFTNALTTNLTAFFREPHHFVKLAAWLPTRRSASAPIRIWCAAASTGEEPYSIAMTVASVFGSSRRAVEIVATDLDTTVLQTARQFFFVTPQDMFPFLKHRKEQGKPMPRITKMEDVR